MNYTTRVKQELAEVMPNARHCRLAELGGLLLVLFRSDDTSECRKISTENPLVMDKIEKLIKKLFSVDISGRIIYDKNRVGKEILTICFTKSETEDILKSVSVDYKLPCCKRAFLRGAFMGCGSLTDPEKDYHLEFATLDIGIAERLTAVMAEFDVEAKIISRKKQQVVYVKDSERIVDLLNVMEAHVILMELENIRIMKDVRNRINRQVNCETANIVKTVAASAKQCTDIEYIRDTIGFDEIDEKVVKTALIRLNNPDATLSELVALHEEKVSKSGINHRLMKISEIANRLRNEEDGKD